MKGKKQEYWILNLILCFQLLTLFLTTIPYSNAIDEQVFFFYQQE